MPQPTSFRSDAAAQTRSGSIDGLRFFGAIGIIWFHTSFTGGWIGYSALPMFTSLYVCFLVGSLQTNTVGQLARIRIRRLLLPWLGWSLIYGLAKIADALVSGVPISSEFSWWMILTGPALHLWFLPFMFVLGLATTALLSAVSGLWRLPLFRAIV